MVNTDRLRDFEDRQRRSARIRERFGLTDRSAGDDSTDWLLGPGAIPAALVVIALVVYVVISIVAGLR